jgi:hypothetical protein
MWPLSLTIVPGAPRREGIGSYRPKKNVWVEIFWMYVAHDLLVGFLASSC